MTFDFKLEPGKKIFRQPVTEYIKPLVSIITPFYNAGKYFEQTWQCVVNQTFPWFEWIIVNDGSTVQEDVDLLIRVAEKDSRIHVYHKENGGISSARNMAIRNAVTDIIIPLDADDLIVPVYLETLYWGLYFNPDYDWCYTNNIGFHRIEYVWNKPFDANRLKTENFLVYSAAIRRKAMEEVGLYDEVEKHYFEDWNLWLKLLSYGKKPVKLSLYGFWYRRLDTGVLSIIDKNPEIYRKAKSIIDEAAKKARTDIKAKEYPVLGKKDEFVRPHGIPWDLKLPHRNNKIKVMLLIPWMEMGGADIFNLNVVKGLDKEKFDISILTTVHGGNALKQQFEEHIPEIYELPAFLDRKDYAPFIDHFIRSREINILFLTNSYYGYYLIPWIRKNHPDLVILDYVHMEEWYWKSGGYARTSGALGNIVEKTYVCNSATRKVMENTFGRDAESVEVLYIGVDNEYFSPEAVEKGLIRKQWGIDEAAPVILFPCRIHPQKRPFLMLEIAKKTIEKIKNAVFLVVGDGPQLEHLKQETNRTGLSKNILFTGFQQDMRPFYKDSDITLICSLKEGLALTAYESLAMGKPVITSDVGGQSELVNEAVGAVIPLFENEKTDLDNRVYSCEEIMAYVEAIIKLLEDKAAYRNRCEAARKRIEQGFSIKLMIEKLENEFTKYVSDEKLVEKRNQVSNSLKMFSGLTEDYLALYTEYENAEQERDDVWKQREWFRNLLEKKKLGGLYQFARKLYRKGKNILKKIFNKLK